MPKTVQAGCFYEFERADQPYEVGREISRAWALFRIRSGIVKEAKETKDVYTPRRKDARRLARSAYPGVPVEDAPHSEDYFSHFHPGDREEGFGHVFFDSRGEGY